MMTLGLQERSYFVVPSWSAHTLKSDSLSTLLPPSMWVTLHTGIHHEQALLRKYEWLFGANGHESGLLTQSAKVCSPWCTEEAPRSERCDNRYAEQHGR